MTDLSYTAVFCFADGRIATSGITMADIEVKGMVCEGKPFRQLGRLWKAMLFVEETQVLHCGACRNDEVTSPLDNASVCSWHYLKALQALAHAEATLAAIREHCEYRGAYSTVARDVLALLDAAPKEQQ